MPPFCVPCPPDAMPDRPTMSTPLDMQDQDGRAQMISSLLTALSDAEVAATENSNVDNPQRQRMLATQAYTSLCFDFPMVQSSALAALASAFRSNPLDVGRTIFPITEIFTAGLRYLASVECANQSSSDEPAAETDSESVNDSQFRCQHVLELCGCVFLLAPALGLAVAPKDDGASLHEFLHAFNQSSIHESDHKHHSKEAAMSDADFEKKKILSHVADACDLQTKEVDSSTYNDMPAEMDDDDSDWEALETFSPPSTEVLIEEPSFQNLPQKVGWSDLVGKVLLLTGVAPPEILKSNIWEELQLTDHLIQALKSMRQMQEKGAEAVLIATAKLYAELLLDHLLQGWNSSSGEILKVVHMLMILAERPGEYKQRKPDASVPSFSKSWELLVLSTLAKLCAKIGRYPVKIFSLNCANMQPIKQSSPSRSRNYGSSPSTAFIRNLWQVAFSNVRFLHQQLAEAPGGPDSFPHLEMVFGILCFIIKCAPGNVDFRPTLLESGIFRSSLQLFEKAGGEAEMEPLRHFLLLSLASSPSLAQFAVQVPSFIATMSAPDFFMKGSYSKAHGIIWPLLIQVADLQVPTSRSLAGYPNQFKPNEAEGIVAAAFNEIVDTVADGAMRKNPFIFSEKLVLIQQLLSLLEEAVSVCPGPTFKLWQRGGPLNIVFARCQVALGSVLVSKTNTTSSSSCKPVASEKNSDEVKTKSSDLIPELSLTCANDEFKEKTTGKSKGYDCEIAMLEKLEELLPSMLFHLKLLSGFPKRDQRGKID